MRIWKRWVSHPRTRRARTACTHALAGENFRCNWRVIARLRGGGGHCRHEEDRAQSVPQGAGVRLVASLIPTGLQLREHMRGAVPCFMPAAIATTWKCRPLKKRASIVTLTALHHMAAAADAATEGCLDG